MSRGFKIALSLTAFLYVAAFFVLTSKMSGKTSRYEKFLCSHCGKERVTVKASWRGIPTKNTEEITESVFFRFLDDRASEACNHNWLRLYFDFESPRGTGHGRREGESVLLFLERSEAARTSFVQAAKNSGLTRREAWNLTATLLFESETEKFDEYVESFFDVWDDQPEELTLVFMEMFSAQPIRR